MSQKPVLSSLRRRSYDLPSKPKAKPRSRSAYWHSRRADKGHDWKAELKQTIKKKLDTSTEVPKEVADAFRRYRKSRVSSTIRVRESPQPSQVDHQEKETFPLSPLAILKSSEPIPEIPSTERVVLVVTPDSTLQVQSESSIAPGTTSTSANVKVLVPSLTTERAEGSSANSSGFGDVVKGFQSVVQPLLMAFGCIVLVRFGFVGNAWLLCLPATAAASYAQVPSQKSDLVSTSDSESYALMMKKPLLGFTSLSSRFHAYAPELRPDAFIASIWPAL